MFSCEWCPDLHARNPFSQHRRTTTCGRFRTSSPRGHAIDRLHRRLARLREPNGEPAQAARAAMRCAFFTDTPEWKKAVLTQSREAAVQAIDGMAAWR